jgi:2-polyprenyl-3-methyl-5-hydroxy-6-metoxy-1,4-benzoquinol methylase
MPNYGDPKYWEDRYNEQKDVTFDWLEDYESLKSIIYDFHLDKSAKLINMGCGNSEFCENMYDDGYHNVYNIDICENVIQNMKERNKTREKMICNFIYMFALES